MWFAIDFGSRYNFSLMERISSQIVEQRIEQPQLREIFRAQSTMGEILGRDGEGPLGLLTTPADVREYETPRTFVYFVYFEQVHLFGKDLIQVLRLARARPETLGDQPQTRQDILADWNLVDRMGKEDSYSQRLVDLHQAGLRSFWTEFDLYHRRKFMAAVNAYESDVVEEVFEREAARIVSKKRAISQLDSLLKQVFEQDEGESLRRHLSVNPHLLEKWLKGRGEDVEGKDTILILSAEHLGRLIENNPQSIKGMLLEGVLSGLLTVVDTEGSPKSIKRGPVDELGSFSVNYLGCDRLKIQVGNSGLMLDLNGGSAQETGRLIIDPYERALIPWMVWRVDKSTGRRSYLASNIPAQLREIVDDRANSLVGLVVATALSKNQRDKLPRKKGLKGGNYKQDMREAQMPVLVSMYRSKILKGPVFKGVEKFSGNHRGFWKRVCSSN